MAGMVSATKAALGLATFAEAEILPALEGWRRHAGSVGIFFFSREAESLIAEAANGKMTSLLGVTDGEGNIDVETVAAGLKDAIKKHGKLEVEIPLLGMEFKFGEKDVDTLLEHIAKAQG